MQRPLETLKFALYKAIRCRCAGISLDDSTITSLITLTKGLVSTPYVWTAMPATDVSLFPDDQYYTVYSCLVSNNPFVIIQADYFDPEWNRYYEFDVVSCMYT